MKRKNKKVKQSDSVYGLCITGSILLVIVALFLPQVIFTIQDEYRMKDIEVEVRSSLDISQLNLSYEQQLNTRLQNVLTIRNETITAIDYEFDNDLELQELVERIFYQQWFELLYSNVLMTNYVLTDEYNKTLNANIKDCKKYLIHGADYQDGIVLMMWYLDIWLPDVDTRIRLLVDSETNTIYYVKITAVGEQTNKDDKKEQITKDIEHQEYLYYLSDIVSSYYDFYYTYYDADLYNQYDKLNEDKWYIEYGIADQKCDVIFWFPYGELHTDFLFRAAYNGGFYPDIAMGLSTIAEKIPEMIQD